MLMLPRRDITKQSLQPQCKPKEQKEEQTKMWKFQNNSGVQIHTGNSNADKIAENLRNISNIIGYQKPQQVESKAVCKESADQLCEEHEKLIDVILNEEEDLISSHKGCVDRCVESIKTEMALIQQVDQPNSDVNEYVTRLGVILSERADEIAVLRGKLRQFAEHLQQEKEISSRFEKSNEPEQLLSGDLMIDL